VSGTTFLSARPALDTSGGGGGGGGGSDGGSAAVGQVTGLSQDTGIPGDFKTNVANQTVSGTYTGALAAGDVIQVSADGSTWIGATAGAGTWTAGVTLLPGEHTLSVRTVDDVGNIVNGTGHAYDLDLTGSVAIESSGATQLDQVADQFFLRDSGGFDSSLKYQGNAVTAGQFGAWTPIGAEKTAGGYQVAWKFGSADQYIVWNLDSNGNYASYATGVVSGSDPELQNLETVFQQDLNADGTTGLATTTTESSGSTRLLANLADNSSTAVNAESPAANQANAAATPQSLGSTGDSGVLLLSNYMASTFAPTGGEATGGLTAAEAFHEQLLAKPAV
jgi:hypothetical protein